MSDGDILLNPGMKVCFTGADDVRYRLIELAEQAGVIVQKGYTKSKCDLLIAEDINTQSNKAKNARRWGKPIMSNKDFVRQAEEIVQVMQQDEPK